MASRADFVEYIAEQCGGAGEITAKKMFGDYGIYCDGKIFGLICDDRFYLKPTEAVRPADVDDRDYLSLLVRETCKALPAPKPKKR